MRHRPHPPGRAWRLVLLALLLVTLGAALHPAPAALADPSTRPVPTTSESTFTGQPSTRAGAASPGRGPVVLLGAPGLRWSDVNRAATPTLWTLANSGPVGTVSVRSILAPTCAVDAWLVLGAGRAVSDAPQAPPCPEPAEPAQGRVPGWDRHLRQAAAEEGQPRLGTLGEALRRNGRTVAAVGAGAALATATPDGRVPAAYFPAAPGHAPAVRAALAGHPDLLVVDAGRIWITPERMARADQVREVERAVADVLPLLPQDATVILAGTAASDKDPRLGMVALSGSDEKGARYKAGVLGSGSSRQNGLLRGPDITATVLHLLDVPVPEEVDGAPMKVVGQEGASSEEVLKDVADRELATGTVNPLSRWFVGGLLLSGTGLVWLAWRALHRRRAQVLQAADDDAARRSAEAVPVATDDELRSLAALRYVALTLSALPVVTFVATLIPWWRTVLPGLALTPVLVALAVAVMSIVLAEPWRRHPTGPAAAVAALTGAVLAADTATGSRLQVDALLGGGQESSGRIEGMSDLGFALFLAASLVLGTCLAEWCWRTGRGRRATLPVLALGVASSLVVALPGLGDSVSGLIAIVPGFLLLAFIAAGGRFSWRVVTAVTLATLALVAMLAALDLRRVPARRTRLGRFLAGLQDGAAWDVVGRKAHAVERATAGDMLTLGILVGVAAVVLVLARRTPGSSTSPLRELSGSRHVVTRGSVVVAMTLLLAAVTTDGGGAVPGLGALLVVPLALAAVAQHRLEVAGAPRTSPVRPRDPEAPRDEPGARPVQRPAPTWADEAREHRVPPVG